MKYMGTLTIMGVLTNRKWFITLQNLFPFFLRLYNEFDIFYMISHTLPYSEDREKSTPSPNYNAIITAVLFFDIKTTV
jgi:hypothetical protein